MAFAGVAVIESEAHRDGMLVTVNWSDGREETHHIETVLRNNLGEVTKRYDVLQEVVGLFKPTYVCDFHVSPGGRYRGYITKASNHQGNF